LINIISVLAANQSLDVTCFALAAGHYLKFWRCVCKPGIKINSVYYCDNIQILEQGLLPDIRYLSKDDFHFQQDGALAVHAMRIIAYLRSHAPQSTELNRQNGRKTVRI